MEKGLKFVVMLSLKEMALRRVAVLLSNDCEIPLSINPENVTINPGAIPVGYCYSDNDWVRWLHTNEDTVKYKISQLVLPVSLRNQMIDKVRPICLEIRKWTECLRELLGDITKFVWAMFYWTTAGTIDYKKTAEALLDCEVLDYDLDIEKRYELASLYCLDDYIPLIWEELAEDRKKYFLSRIRDGRYLEYCWPRILKGEYSDLDYLWKTSPGNLTSFNQWAFEASAKDFDKTGAEYFFRKLTHDERDVSLMRTTLQMILDIPHPIVRLDSPYQNYSGFYDVLCFLLSLMTHEQQMEIIKKHPVHVLLCFSVMIWQDLLLENACLIWPSLPTGDYDNLLQNIFCIEIADCFNPNSFREFFITSPLHFKKDFVHQESSIWGITPAHRFLKLFFKRQDSDSIEFIFRNVDVTDRAPIVLNNSVLRFFKIGFMYEKWMHMVKVCFREAKLSMKDTERLKREHPFLRRLIGELESDAFAEK